MKRLLFFVFLTIMTWRESIAQSDSLFQFERSVPGNIRFFSVDPLGNLFLIDKKDQVKKRSATGDSLAVYNDVRRLGVLSGIDVSNPLQPILYYGDGVRFVVLDRFLNPVTRIDLQSRNILQLNTWSRSFDNQLWAYDPIAFALKKVDLTGQTQWSTPDLRLILGRAYSPTRIEDHDQRIYLYAPHQGVYVFDYFGNLKNGILIQDWQDWQVDGGFIYGRKADTLYRYEIKSTYYDAWTLPAELRGSESLLIRGKRLYALFREGNTDRLRIYSMR